MRPATGWIAYFHVDAALHEQVGEVAHRVLRLRDRHAVAGHDDQRADVGEQHGRVLARDLAHRARGGGAPAGGGRGGGAEASEQHVAERAVHRLAHELREQRARGADQRAGDDERVVVEHEPGRGGGKAGERVEQRDHDRHVGAADRHHHQRSERQRREHEQQEPRHVPAVQHAYHCDRDQRREREVRHAHDAGGGRALGDQPLQLGERDRAPAERDRADDGAEHLRHRRRRGSRSARRGSPRSGSSR